MPTDRSHPWHVTAVTHAGRPCFAHFAAGAAIGCELMLMRLGGLWDVLAWVLLPCRFDAVIAPLRGRLDDTVPRFLARAADRIARVEDDPRPVWAARFVHRPLRGEGEAEATTRALLRALLRAELVERLSDYPFWDSAWIAAAMPRPASPGRKRRLAPCAPVRPADPDAPIRWEPAAVVAAARWGGSMAVTERDT